MDIQLETRVEQWIANHREELIQDIIRLVNIKSLSDKTSPVKPYGQGCLDALHTMLELAQSYGFSTTNYENYMGSIGTEHPGETIGFWGHLDVVPEGDNWDFEPYHAVYKDGFIIGRGAQDNKGQTLAVLYVLRCIKELGLPLKHNLRLWVGCDEETGMSDMEYYLGKGYPLPQFSIIADSNYPVCYGEKGILVARLSSHKKLSQEVVSFTGGVASNIVPDVANVVLRKSPRVLDHLNQLGQEIDVLVETETVTLTARGISGHTAFPQSGVNAIYLLCRALCSSGVLGDEDMQALTFFAECNGCYDGSGLGINCQDDMSGPLTCVGSMASLCNGVFSLAFNIRYPVTQSAEDLVDKLHRCAAINGCTVKMERVDPAHYFPREHPVVDAMTNLFNDLTGQQAKPFVLPGGTYARKLPNAISFGMGGLPTPTAKTLFPPGHGGAHGPDEATSVDNLLLSIKIFIHCLVAIDDLDLSI